MQDSTEVVWVVPSSTTGGKAFIEEGCPIKLDPEKYKDGNIFTGPMDSGKRETLFLERKVIGETKAIRVVAAAVWSFATPQELDLARQVFGHHMKC